VLQALREWQRQGRQQQEQPVALVVREAVECKNHAPFAAR
jgi:hypothetical protein